MNEKWEKYINSAEDFDPDCLPTRLVMEYVDGTLKSEERAEVQTHIENCDYCREQIIDFAHALQRREKKLISQALEKWLLEATPIDKQDKQEAYIWAESKNNQIPADIPLLLQIIDGPQLDNRGLFTIELLLSEKRILDEDLKRLKGIPLTLYIGNYRVSSKLITDRHLIYQWEFDESTSDGFQAFIDNLSEEAQYIPITKSLRFVLEEPIFVSESVIVSDPVEAIILELSPPVEVPNPQVPTPIVWTSTEKNLRNLAEGIQIEIKVQQENFQSTFDRLPDFLSSTLRAAHAPVVEPMRSSNKELRHQRYQGQILTLPDPDEDLLIILAIQPADDGRSHLSLELKELEGKKSVKNAQVILTYSTGKESTFIRNEKVIFTNLEQDHYKIEIVIRDGKRVNKTWEFNINISEG